MEASTLRKLWNFQHPNPTPPPNPPGCLLSPLEKDALPLSIVLSCWSLVTQPSLVWSVSLYKFSSVKRRKGIVHNQVVPQGHQPLKSIHCLPSLSTRIGISSICLFEEKVILLCLITRLTKKGKVFK